MTDDFDRLFFTESTFGTPIVAGSTVTIPVQGVLPLKGYPRADGTLSLSGRIVFKGVEKSTRTVTEYIGDPHHPDGFKEPISVEDGVAAACLTEGVREYAFEGVQAEPVAWLDWTILAKSFEFVVEEGAPNIAPNKR